MMALASAVMFGALAVLSKFWLEPAGQVIFDSRVQGYDLAEAQAYLAAIDEGQRALYLGLFRTLDTAFPVLLALTLVVGVVIRAPGALGLLRMIALAATVAYLALDLSENAVVAQILRSGETVTEALVARASGLTMGKWIALSVAMFLAALTWGRGRAS